MTGNEYQARGIIISNEVLFYATYFQPEKPSVKFRCKDSVYDWVRIRGDKNDTEAYN